MASTASPKQKEQMQAVLTKDSPTNKEAMSISRWVRKYTQGYQNKTEPKVGIGGMIRGIIASPDYRFKDFIAIVKNGYMKNNISRKHINCKNSYSLGCDLDNMISE